MKLIVGCGYLGRRVARRWRQAGSEVVGLVRDESQAAELVCAGIRPLLADVTRPETLRGLPPAETVLWAVGFDPAGGKSRREVYVDGLREVLDALLPARSYGCEAVARVRSSGFSRQFAQEPPEGGTTNNALPPAGASPLPRVIFISSTGVYGESGGAWVDEDSPCRPTRDAATALLAAEALLASHPLGSRGIVLRLAGLYGPGRLPRTAELRAGGPLPVPREQVVNLIHVDDAAAVVLAAEALARPPRLYLVSDGQPPTRRQYLERLAEVLGLPPPQFCDPRPGDVSAGRGLGDKRVRNTRMLAELGVRLAYPTYWEGLAAAVGEEAG